MQSTAIADTLSQEIKTVITRHLPGWLETDESLRSRLHRALLVENETISYDDFLTAYADVHAEWIDGKVLVMSPASDRHQDIVDFFTALLRIFVENYRLGWVRSAPFQMKLPFSIGREPDILFVAQERMNRLRLNYLDGPADLAAEVVSPESVARDRGEKFSEYEQAGVAEYWLLDPLRKQAAIYLLVDGSYQLTRPHDDGRVHSSVLPGFWLREEWIWETPLPPVLDTLRELGVLPDLKIATDELINCTGQEDDEM